MKTKINLTDIKLKKRKFKHGIVYIIEHPLLEGKKKN